MGRQGVDLAEVEGTVAEELPPQRGAERHAFYFKFMLDPAGGRFDSDPALVHVKRVQDDVRRQRIDGSLVLRDSRFDPIADFPVESIVSITYTDNYQSQTGSVVGHVPPEWIWPFRHQRYDGLIARLQPA
jgi:acetoacetate decarboxylase